LKWCETMRKNEEEEEGVRDANVWEKSEGMRTDTKNSLVVSGRRERLGQMRGVVFSSNDYQNVGSFFNFCYCCGYSSSHVHLTLSTRSSTPRTHHHHQRQTNHSKNRCKTTVQKRSWRVPAPLELPRLIVTHRVVHFISQSSNIFRTQIQIQLHLYILYIYLLHQTLFFLHNSTNLLCSIFNFFFVIALEIII